MYETLIASGADLSVKLSDHRKTLFRWLRRCLEGPRSNTAYESEENILNGMRPLDCFQIGILYPIVRGEAGIDPATEEAEEDEDDAPPDARPADVESDESETAKSVRKKPRYVPPSSAGFSFFVQGDEIRLQINPWGVRYELEPQYHKPNRWIRKPFSDRLLLLPPFLSPTSRAASAEALSPVFDGRAEVQVLWRPYKKGWLTTVSLSNRQIFPDEISARAYPDRQNQLCLFEVRLECIIESGHVGTYPRVDPALLSQEEQELEMQYRNRRIYALGHGAAVDWQVNNGRVEEIRIDFLPKVEVPQISVASTGRGRRVLDLQYLAAYAKQPQAVHADLEMFLHAYKKWISGRKASAENLAQQQDRDVAERILKRMQRALTRMQSGLRLLKTDRAAAEAFAFANEAMYRQMRQSDLSREKPEKEYRWRPFQLAFLLMEIESVVNTESEFRDTVDLIWFPTGGGKTESYLGLIAFVVAWRRLRYPSTSGGTTVLMRYTLRLLTRQQFQRAARLVCAMELLRRGCPDKLGSEVISIGIWVGEALSPNSYKKACQVVAKAGRQDTRVLQNLVMDQCPWCGQLFSADRNYLATHARFGFQCTNPECPFGTSVSENECLPCNVVDEALYENPPTLLIATIDKFARLAWEERSAAFFGVNGQRPPELIIQDELHLITGALGSIAGLYEAAVDTVLRHRGVYPKYIASTATIRMAAQQVKRLYGRSVAVFPPPGLSIDDSFFARTIPLAEKPGRLYVGYFAHHLKRTDSLAPLAAAVLAAPEQLFCRQADKDILLDAWWTMVVFHSSLKGVGRSHNAFNIDVPLYWSRYVNAVANKADSTTTDDDDMTAASCRGENRLKNFKRRIAQLTSISSPEENAETFSRLERPFNDARQLDAVLATNMISVGLDVSRLAVMIINGQPLTTAEYIQSSSRVGRGRVPGIVITNYYRDQARSLSHYESFRPYHESFYRFVEPSSITPFTYQARRRALHAALVIAMRHCCPNFRENQSAGNFTSASPDVRKVMELFLRRCCEADPENAGEVEKHVRMLVGQWEGEAERCRREKRRLDYQAPAGNKVTDRLLHTHGDRIQGLWSTLQSMRNVEDTALLKLL